jgi:hypothetical protein
MSELGLAEAINQLRRELGRAIDAGRGEHLQFTLGPVELELQLGLSTKGTATAEAKWVVLSFGVEAGREHTRTHTIKLTLTPQLDGSKDVSVSDRRADRD